MEETRVKFEKERTAERSWKDPIRRKPEQAMRISVRRVLERILFKIKGC
jgi:hypothetical protein